MRIRWTPDGKVERYPDHAEPPSWGELADALDECVAALRELEKAAKAIDYEMFNGMTPSVGSVNKLKNALSAIDAARGK